MMSLSISGKKEEASLGLVNIWWACAHAYMVWSITTSCSKKYASHLIGKGMGIVQPGNTVMK